MASRVVPVAVASALRAADQNNQTDRVGQDLEEGIVNLDEVDLSPPMLPATAARSRRCNLTKTWLVVLWACVQFVAAFLHIMTQYVCEQDLPGNIATNAACVYTTSAVTIAGFYSLLGFVVALYCHKFVQRHQLWMCALFSTCISIATVWSWASLLAQGAGMGLLFQYTSIPITVAATGNVFMTLAGIVWFVAIKPTLSTFCCCCNRAKSMGAAVPPGWERYHPSNRTQENMQESTVKL